MNSRVKCKFPVKLSQVTGRVFVRRSTKNVKFDFIFKYIKMNEEVQRQINEKKKF